jgi:cytochrome c oxidase subunit 3
MLGMWIFLVSLGMVFLTTVIAYLIIRSQLISTGEWQLDDPPGLPRLLYTSTFLLLAASMVFRAATVSTRRPLRSSQTGRWMLFACLLVLGFLVTQTFAWIDLATNEKLAFDSSLYAWLFYVLTGLHVAHVLVGLPPLALTTKNALQGRYRNSEGQVCGLTYCVMYWHFLDGVWVVLFLVLLFGMRS